MKTLILTCNTGHGHNATAAALRDRFTHRGESCEVMDALSFLSVIASRIVGRVQTRLYLSFPRVFSNGYRMAEEHPRAFRRNTPIRRALNAGSRRMLQYLREGAFDTVICTHVFAALMLSDTMERYPSLRLKTCFVATDYTCYPSVNESRMDAYVIPDDRLCEDFVRCGVPRERLHGLGIPIRAPFAERCDRIAAKQALGLPTEGKHLLLMCGSLGCGPMEKLTELLLAAAPQDVTLSVVCGTNTALQKRLTKKYGKHAALHVHGFIDDIPLLMDSADLYLTKPGGISVSEAATKQLPMVLMSVVAGCEQYNLRYFVEHGMAKTADTPQELAALCLSLLQGEDGEIERMAAAMAQHAHPYAADAVYQLLRDMPQEHDAPQDDAQRKGA